MRDNASDGCLHRCSCRREKQVRSLQECITLQEKIRRHTHHTHRPSTGRPVVTHSHKRKSSRDMRSAQEKQLVNERVGAEQQEVRDFFQNSEQKKQSKENMKPYRDSWKRNLIRGYFLTSRRVKHSQRQHLRYFCRRRGRSMQHMQYKI